MFGALTSSWALTIEACEASCVSSPLPASLSGAPRAWGPPPIAACSCPRLPSFCIPTHICRRLRAFAHSAHSPPPYSAGDASTRRPARALILAPRARDGALSVVTRHRRTSEAVGRTRSWRRRRLHLAPPPPPPSPPPPLIRSLTYTHGHTPPHRPTLPSTPNPPVQPELAHITPSHPELRCPGVLVEVPRRQPKW